MYKLFKLILLSLVFLLIAFIVRSYVKIPESSSGCTKADLDKYGGCFAKEYLFKIDFSDGKKVRENIVCQEYYDQIDFSTRGNYWTYREVGLKDYSETRTIFFDSEKYGKVKMGLPRCTVLIEGEESLLNSMSLMIGDAVYGYQTSDKNQHHYKRLWGNNNVPEKISFNFDVSIMLIRKSEK